MEIRSFEVIEVSEDIKTSPSDITPILLKATLIVIEKKLSAIENRENKIRSYAEAASTPHISHANVKRATHNEDRLKTSSKTPKTSVEKQKDKELIIQITNAEEKEKLEKEPIKKITDRLREEQDEVVNINRLASGNIRILSDRILRL